MDKAARTASLIFEGFMTYKTAFEEISGRGQGYFEQRDWKNQREDFSNRLYLHNNEVKNTFDRLTEEGDIGPDKELWKQVKQHFATAMAARRDKELAATFFNSLTRKFFLKQEADPECEFLEREEPDTEIRISKSFGTGFSLVSTVKEIMQAFPFDQPYYNMEEDALLIARRIFEDMETRHGGILGFRRIEVLNVHFFRNKRAYLIGKVKTQQGDHPLLIPFVHTDLGIVADTALVSEDEAEIVFSFTRSYFLVDVKYPRPYVNYLKLMMPRKKYYEIYNALGYNKHGKTLLYRQFTRYISNTMDQFVHAPGVRGMVMAVIMLPGYDVVFKIIKDEFDPPKTVTRAEVIEKYRLVYKHGRMGRLADTHEYEYVYFDRERFSPGLLDELLATASNTVKIVNGKVMIRQLFTERKMRPLNLFIDENPVDTCKKAVIDYGYALKDLAYANIFPGDLLMKNFGVTRFGRVIFYDYDEITRITDCNFRQMPEPANAAELYAPQPFYEVKPNDIFPEEFRHYLVPPGELREIFITYHPELFEVSFWENLKQKHLADEVIDVSPYHHSRRFRNVPIR